VLPCSCMVESMEALSFSPRHLRVTHPRPQVRGTSSNVVGFPGVPGNPGADGRPGATGPAGAQGVQGPASSQAG
jgi:hypothetical protein